MNCIRITSSLLECILSVFLNSTIIEKFAKSFYPIQFFPAVADILSPSNSTIKLLESQCQRSFTSRFQIVLLMNSTFALHLIRDIHRDIAKLQSIHTLDNRINANTFSVGVVHSVMCSFFVKIMRGKAAS